MKNEQTIYTAGGVLATALAVAEALASLEARIFDARAARTRKLEMIASREAEIMNAVTGAIGADGKAMYSNDTSRKSAAAVKTANDAVLATARNEVAEMDADIAGKEAKAAELRNQISLYRAYLHGGRE